MFCSTRLIFGFIGKQHLHLILKDRPNGTFLLRFSDSEIGGITIAYVSASESKCFCGPILSLVKNVFPQILLFPIWTMMKRTGTPSEFSVDMVTRVIIQYIFYICYFYVKEFQRFILIIAI